MPKPRERSWSKAGVLVASIMVIGFAANQSRADLIFGLHVGASPGIYLIDTATGQTSLYRSAPMASLGNSLAYNPANDSFFYTRSGSSSPQVVLNTTSGSEIVLGALKTTNGVTSGTFYNGSYWVQPNYTAGILEAWQFGGGVASVLRGIPAYPTTVTYGDIASDANGVTYASHSRGMHRYDLNALAAGCTALPNANVFQMQLAFGPTGLFGLSGSRIYRINTSNGAATPISQVQGNFQFIDLASVPSPGGLGLLASTGFVLAQRRRRLRQDGRSATTEASRR
ncbi:MAG: hypothetical protein KF678_10520 [Phycisphaeraceae bacterium]|nr:hypothetical protein [Phycisphaeraceae bacterium]